jgi:hypothetical protein
LGASVARLKLAEHAVSYVSSAANGRAHQSSNQHALAGPGTSTNAARPPSQACAELRNNDAVAVTDSTPDLLATPGAAAGLERGNRLAALPVTPRRAASGQRSGSDHAAFSPLYVLGQDDGDMGWGETYAHMLNHGDTPVDTGAMLMDVDWDTESPLDQENLGRMLNAQDERVPTSRKAHPCHTHCAPTMADVRHGE